MTSYSTICRACYGKIETPAPHRHMCARCEENDAWLVEESQNTQYERPDYSDLTHLIARLPKERFVATSAWMAATGKRPERQEREPVWIGLFLILAVNAITVGTMAVVAYWLGKQAGLWGEL